VEFHSGAARRDPACPRHAKKTPRNGTNDYDVQRIWLRFRIIPIPPEKSPPTPIKTRNQLIECFVSRSRYISGGAGTIDSDISRKINDERY
jgi:hypothetical protein